MHAPKHSTDGVTAVHRGMHTELMNDDCKESGE